MPTLIPRGVPLTDSMPFVARDGVRWLAYLEGFIPERPWVMWYRTLLPGRRLRFVSAGESRMITCIPAGAPFLSEDRLRTLLDNARPLPPAPPSRPSRYSPWRRNPVSNWTARAGDLGGAVMAESVRRWRQGAGRRRALRHQVARTVGGTVETLLAKLEGARTQAQRTPPTGIHRA
jgi:hypothetical protein